MKIRILLCFLLFNYKNVLSEKLSPEENNKRLEKCGRKFNSRPIDNNVKLAHSSTDWIVKVRSKNGKLSPTTGSFISSRHVLTSVQSIITGNREWRLNGKKFYANCSNIVKDFEVPKPVVDDIEIIQFGYCSDTNCGMKMIRAVKAFVLDFCENKHFDRMFRMMIVEVDGYATDNFACISNETTITKNGDEVDIYGFSVADLIYRRREITIGDEYITTPKYYAIGDRGGPMVKDDNGRAIIVGVGASPGYDDQSSYTFFFKLSKYSKSICNLIGLCKWKNLPRITKKSNETSSTIRVTTTSQLNTSTSSTIYEKNSKNVNFNTGNPEIESTTTCQFENENIEETEELDDEITETNAITTKKNTEQLNFINFLFVFIYVYSITT